MLITSWVSETTRPMRSPVAKILGGAVLPSTRQFLSANGLSAPSHSILRHTTPIMSRGCIRTTHAQTMTSILRPKKKLAIQLAHIRANPRYLAADTWSTMTPIP
jgi:hypothetical protein